MKDSFKKLGILLVIMVISIIMPKSVSAATEMPAAVNGVVTLTEDVTLTNSFTVKSGEDITLDLKTFKLESTGSDTIVVEFNGKLTIKGTGSVVNDIKGYANLLNNGTTVIESGNFTRSETGYSNAISYYVILNHGDLHIKDATVKNEGTFSSLIANGYFDFPNSNSRSGHVSGVNWESPKITIDGGTFDGGKNTIKNDDNGIMVINGGTFKNSNQVSLLNWNEATINGGTFLTPSGDKTNICIKNNSTKSYNKGILVINGGTFEADYTLEGYVSTPVEINGGEFKYANGFFNTNPDKTEASLSGDDGIVLNDGVFANDQLVSRYQSDVNREIITNTDGSVEIKYKDADYSKITALVKEIDTLDLTAYTEASREKLETALNAIVYNLYITRQADVDKMAKDLEDAFNGLEYGVSTASGTSDPTGTVNNPNTSDDITYFILLSIISLAGIAIVYKKRYNN